ncbi:MAG: cation:proton antiporter [Oligoflexales bacterium]|nr:cation:proton antiporter [Oligoflexales bacterium]
MSFWVLLADIGILLGAALVLGGVAIRLKLSPLVGYLLAGVFLAGPGSLRLVGSEGEISAISELGVSLLLFSLGLEFSWEKMRAFGRSTIVASILQILLTPFFAVIVCHFFDVEFLLSITIGMMVSLSSTAAVIRILADQSEMDSAHGRNALAVLLMQDIAVVPFAIIVSLMTSQGTSKEILYKVGITVAGAVFLVAGLYIILNKISVRVMGLFTLEKNREMAVILTVTTAIGSSWLSHKIGISPAMGAFVAGMILASSPFAPQIRSDISPLKILLLTLFFSAAGIMANPVWIFRNFGMVLGFAFIILIGKTFLTALLFRICRVPSTVAIASGLCLAQIGEFAFVLATLSKNGGLMSDDFFQLFISVTIICLIATPFMVTNANRIASFVYYRVFRKKSSCKTVSHSNKHPGAEIYILGFGPAGQEVARKIKEAGREAIIIDLNRVAIEKARALGFECYVGDIQQYEVLKHFGIDGARLIVITIPSKSTILQVLHNVRQLSPDAITIVRARYQVHIPLFVDLGASEVIGDEDVVASSLAVAVMNRL